MGLALPESKQGNGHRIRNQRQRAQKCRQEIQAMQRVTGRQMRAGALLLLITTGAGMWSIRAQPWKAMNSSGVIRDIIAEEVEGKASPSAALAGAIIGGLIGSQIGVDEGKKSSAALGAISGAVLASEWDRKNNKQVIYNVVIELDGGEDRLIEMASVDGFQRGDKVRITTAGLQLI